jgi:hypothetical protein
MAILGLGTANSKVQSMITVDEVQDLANGGSTQS